MCPPGIIIFAFFRVKGRKKAPHLKNIGKKPVNAGKNKQK